MASTLEASIAQITRGLSWFLLTGCAAPPAPLQSAAENEQLRALIAQQRTQAARFSEAPPAQRQACEVSVGDCRLTVDEKRDRLIHEQRRSECKSPELDLEAQCIVDDLPDTVDASLALDFLRSEIWCLEKLTDCLALQKEQAANAASDKLAETRRRAVENDPAGIAARSQISLAEASITYLRATLPPDAEDECQTEKSSGDCRQRARDGLLPLNEIYRLPEGEYVAEHAARLYATAASDEARCLSPELSCVKGALSKYGETAETRILLERNLKILEKRQEQLETVGAMLAEPCIERGIAEHQPEIVRSYLAYVREPVLFFRMKLHRAFLAMHQAQLDCIVSLTKNAR